MSLALPAALCVVSILAAAVYGVGLLHKPPSLMRTLVKALAVGALAVVAWLSGHVWLLAVGFTLSALGDAFLAGDANRWLPFGLVSFLVAHAAYIVVFLHAGGGVALIRMQPIRVSGLLAASAGAVLVSRLIAPRLGALAGPVIVYMLAVLAMVGAATALPAERWAAIAGAFAFFTSDGVLAIRLFKYDGRPNLKADFAVWWLYYAAQAGIAWAFLGR
jgi:uncharacterized membrane protein YhhN